MFGQAFGHMQEKENDKKKEYPKHNVHYRDCTSCDGTGRTGEDLTEKCKACKGTGQAPGS